MGFASLSRDIDGRSGPVGVDLFLTRESPERLDLEQKLKKYYVVAHDCDQVWSGFSRVPQLIVIKSLRLTSVTDGLVGGLESVW